MVALTENPFFLDQDQKRWVMDTLAGMTVEEKIGQLFCETLWNCTSEESDVIFSEIKPGGVMFRPNTAEDLNKFTQIVQDRSDIPLLIAANFERGGNGGISNGTYYGTQMQVAATDSDACAEQLGIIAGREGAALGFNWSFAPIVDIDENYLSTVTNTRTYGSDPDKIIRMAKGYIEGVHRYNLAATIKHFPGDGKDFRDQHKVATVNSCTVEEWDKTFGKIYRELIAFGADAVMAAHIMCPAYSRFLNPGLKDREILPASLSRELLQGLLRDRLGFNGLIVSDDTHMTGFMTSMEREKAVPFCIAAGVDMFLFTINHREDVEYMRKGVRDGIITQERLDEAVTRILALKAKLRLHEKNNKRRADFGQEIVCCEEHRTWAAACADQAVTLVKDVNGLLPLSPEKYKRLLLIPLEGEKAGRYDNNPQYQKFRESLEAEGFQVSEIDLEEMPGIGKTGTGIRPLKEKYDLMLYFIGAHTGYRINWQSIVCGEITCYTKEIPTMAISFNSPYMLMDIPMVSTYINAYSESDYTREAVVEKIMGRSPFLGVSPVDPFCGMWDLPL